MANMHKEKQRCVRGVPQDDWDTFAVNAARADTDRSALVHTFIRWFNGEPGAELPTRPPPGHDARPTEDASDG